MTSQLERLQQKVRELSLEDVRVFFHPHVPYLKRRLLGGYRAIVKIHNIQDFQGESHLVCCFHEVFSHNDTRYEGKDGFLQNPGVYGSIHFNFNEAEVLEYIQKFESSLTHIKREPLPYHLQEWFSQFPLTNSSDEMGIYESSIWVDRYYHDNIQNYWPDYRNLLGSISQNLPNIERKHTKYSENLSIYIRCHTQNGRSILYQETELEDDSGEVNFLAIAPYESCPSEAEIDATLAALCANDFLTELRFYDRDALSRFATRYYPHRFTLDDNIDLWRRIQKSRNSNFAFSSEEQQILASSRTPLFINGRAGSGKSTMLFHWFACYCKRYIKISSEDYPNCPPPLFLTYNSNLLEDAKNSVKILLEDDFRFIKDPSTDNPTLVQHRQRLAQQLDQFFKPFQTLLLDLLPIEHLDDFAAERHLSFYQFERYYQKSFTPGRDPSAADSWHAIRAFIKGYSLEDLTLADYRVLPNRERTLSPEVFETIHDKVYRWYRKKLCQEYGFWDDQDLVRAVLGAWSSIGTQERAYSAIVCDESQDFTKLELELITRLSCFEQFDLYPPVGMMPFVFAGDPLQTLNPTGFRWESMKAKFHESIELRLDPNQILGISMEFENLEKNYRSSKEIVGLVNCIHLWRSLLLHLEDCRPQESWRLERHQPPQQFILGDNLRVEDLHLCFEREPIILVPCESGGERNFVETDAVLSDYFRADLEANRCPSNVLSASQAKGLEFPFVVLYKFGEEFAQRQFDLAMLLEASDRQNAAISDLTLEYFLNKLYVAVSRATDEAIAIDTPAGHRVLWRHTQDATLVTDPEAAESITLGGTVYSISREVWCFRSGEDAELWRSLTRSLEWGVSIANFERDNRGEQADEFFRKGKGDGNADFMARAESFYRSLEQTDRADLAAAFSLKFSRQWRSAGRAFLALGETQEALECLLGGLCWLELQQWCDDHPAEGLALERPAIRWMSLLIATNSGSGADGVDGANSVNPVNPVNPADNAAERLRDEAYGLDYAAIGERLGATRLCDELGRLTDFLNHSAQEIVRREYRRQQFWQSCIRSYIKMIQQALQAVPSPKLSFAAIDAVSVESISAVIEPTTIGSATVASGDATVWTLEVWSRLGEVLEQLSGGGYGGAFQIAAQCFYRAGIGSDRDEALFERAMKCWEVAGDEYPADYYRAKASLSHAPQNFPDWQQAGEAAAIVAAWDAADRPTDAPWLRQREPLGWALKQTERLPDWFAYLMRGRCWPEAIDVLYQLPPKEFPERALSLTATLALSNLTPDTARHARTQYSQLLKDVRTRLRWRDRLGLSQLGATFERVGEYIPTLKFYESVIERSQSSRQEVQYAKERWLVTKQQQSQYLATTDPMRLQSVLHEIERKSDRWQINLTSLDPEPQPLALRQKLETDVDPTAPTERTPQTGDTTHPPTVTPATEPLDRVVDDPTIHDSTAHDSTAHDSTAHDSTAHDSTAHDSTAHDSTAHEKTTNDDVGRTDDRAQPRPILWGIPTGLQSLPTSQLPAALRFVSETAWVQQIAPHSLYLAIEPFAMHYSEIDRLLYLSVGDVLGRDRVYFKLDDAGIEIELSQGRMQHRNGKLALHLHCGLEVEAICEASERWLQVRKANDRDLLLEVRTFRSF